MYVALPAISCFDRNTCAAVFGALDSRCDHKIFRIRLSGESLVRRTVRRKRAQSVCGDKAAGPFEPRYIGRSQIAGETVNRGPGIPRCRARPQSKSSRRTARMGNSSGQAGRNFARPLLMTSKDLPFDIVLGIILANSTARSRKLPRRKQCVYAFDPHSPLSSIPASAPSIMASATRRRNLISDLCISILLRPLALISPIFCCRIHFSPCRVCSNMVAQNSWRTRHVDISPIISARLGYCFRSSRPPNCQ